MKPGQKLKKKPWQKWLAVVVILAVTGWMLNVSKPGQNVIACPTECARPVATDPPSELRILSLNMLHGFPNFAYLELRTALLIREIGRLNVDVVLLQEVPWTVAHGQVFRTIAEEAGYNFVYLRANGNLGLLGLEEGEMILSRYPLANISFTELRPPPSFFENRVVLHATVMGVKTPIDLFVTHLTGSQETVYQSQIEALRAFVESEADYPAVVAGDFNAWESSPPIARLSEIWQDSYRQAWPKDTGHTCCVTNLTESLPSEMQERIDYLFLVPTGAYRLHLLEVQRVFTEPFVVENQTSNGRLWLSDHAGLLVTLGLDSAP